jgi:hypothetical protein
MAEPEKNFLQQLIDSFSSSKANFEELRQRIGWLGAVVVLLIAAVIAASFYIWSNWKDIKERPGIEGVIKRFKRRAIDKAPAGVLTIAVAHLQDDQGQKQEKLLLDELKHFDGVETLTVDRAVEWPDSGTEQVKKKKAEAKARVLLMKTGADVLVWGSVISLSGKSAMRLNWTPSQDVPGSTGKYLPQTETLALPELFWNDLKQIVGLLTQTRFAELTFDQSGHYIADKRAPDRAGPHAGSEPGRRLESGNPGRSAGQPGRCTCPRWRGVGKERVAGREHRALSQSFERIYPRACAAPMGWDSK